MRVKQKITYKDAGVDIDKADRLIKGIRKRIDTTRIKGSMDSIGGFGGAFDLKKSGEKDPLLIASTDGVGTKLKIAIDAGKHDTIGIDLVAMCVNDCLCLGGRPLFFLDYFASGKLDAGVWAGVIKGIVKGCKNAGCSLLGGETAEMPGMYSRGEYDLAGFAVGVVDRKKVINGKKIKPGNVILGIASSGLHSNGYSLIRRIFTAKELKKNSGIFLKPTHIYVKPVLELLRKIAVKGVANITGGGFYDNIPRILPAKCKAVIRKGSWDIPKVFKMITDKTALDEAELYRTFNMGIGMVMIIAKSDAEKAKTLLRKKHGLKSWVIGDIAKGVRGVKLVQEKSEV
ncbi:MAG: phosphoribosylformylglycinamidine cyclo-ligase [Candidatus Omnitrophica bacterium]|nr:phosphoribosylformylglycinamidine cyclo-ligase [Candidatus Omnitrophota bacterium]MBU1128954.1 phosphoribosylformylglycinamidine cyclo-ligase [Candidatus Omnitrophota bacterium]MBU1784101.1 phosphoribosylformylglycinamidine cyclo-ligase [Candidatus Omnitrophota bacterium]MBU1850831.1 phosphoribosylformylglycinamidine cyclo-ligase [Candidatus Omnitrophota bacterium]